MANTAQARLLLDPRLRPLLSELARRGVASAAELSRALNRPLSSVHAQLIRLLISEVIEQVGVVHRAGRPIRRFQLTLPWCVPFAVTPAATLRELLQGSFQTTLTAQLDRMARVMGRIDSGWEVGIDIRNGQLDETIKPQDQGGLPRFEGVMGVGGHLKLSSQQVRTLKEQINALIADAQANQVEAGEAWMITVLLTPDGDPSATS